MRDFPRLSVINLSELYLTRREHDKLMKRLNRRFGKLNLSIWLVSFTIGMLGAMIYEDRQRIYALERRINEKDGMAG